MKIDAFSNHDFWNAKLNGRPAAKETGHQCGVKNCVLICFLPAGIGEAIDLGMAHRIAALDPAIVPAADNLLVAHEDRSNGKPTLAQSGLCLFKGGFYKWGVG